MTCLTSVDSYRTSSQYQRNKNHMTFIIYIKRAIVCIWSRNCKMGVLEGTGHWILHVNVYRKKLLKRSGLARERVEAGVLNRNETFKLLIYTYANKVTFTAEPAVCSWTNLVIQKHWVGHANCEIYPAAALSLSLRRCMLLFLCACMCMCACTRVCISVHVSVCHFRNPFSRGSSIMLVLNMCVLECVRICVHAMYGGMGEW